MDTVIYIYNIIMLCIIFFAFDPHSCVSLQLPQVRARARLRQLVCGGACVRPARAVRARAPALVRLVCGGARARALEPYIARSSTIDTDRYTAV